VTDFCEHVNEPLGSIKVGEFLAQLSDYYLLKMFNLVFSTDEISFADLKSALGIWFPFLSLILDLYNCTSFCPIYFTSSE